MSFNLLFTVYQKFILFSLLFILSVSACFCIWSIVKRIYYHITFVINYSLINLSLGSHHLFYCLLPYLICLACLTPFISLGFQRSQSCPGHSVNKTNCSSNIRKTLVRCKIGGSGGIVSSEYKDLPVGLLTRNGEV